jgi:hypothetical protein
MKTLTLIPPEEMEATMKESDRLKQQRDALQKRRERWATEATQAEHRLSQARGKALAGDEASAAEITAAQSEYNALAGLLSEAGTQLSELSIQFQDAEAEEKKAANAQRVRELNEQKKANAEAYDERLKDIDEYLRTCVSGLASERLRDSELSREITALGGVSDVQPLAQYRWSTSGLSYAQNIAQMLAEEERRQERREEEQRRINLRSRRDGEPKRVA